MKRNQDFKKWINTLTPDRKRFNFNKIYKILRQVNKEDRFRFCVKQLALDEWEVPVTRLTKEQLRPHLREFHRIDSPSPTVSSSDEKGDVWEVLDECGDDSGPKDNSCMDKTEKSKDSSLQKNFLHNALNQEYTLQDKNIDNANEQNDLKNSSDVSLPLKNETPERDFAQADALQNNKDNGDCENSKESSLQDSCQNDNKMQKNYTEEEELLQKNKDQCCLKNSIDYSLPLKNETPERDFAQADALQNNKDNGDCENSQENSLSDNTLKTSLQERELIQNSNGQNYIENSTEGHFPLKDECLPMGFEQGNTPLQDKKDNSDFENCKESSLLDACQNDKALQNYIEEEEPLQKKKDQCHLKNSNDYTDFEHGDALQNNIDSGDYENSQENSLSDNTLETGLQEGELIQNSKGQNDLENSMACHFPLKDECLQMGFEKGTPLQDKKDNYDCENSKDSSLQEGHHNDKTSQNYIEEEEPLQKNKDQCYLKKSINDSLPLSNETSETNFKQGDVPQNNKDSRGYEHSQENSLPNNCLNDNKFEARLHEGEPTQNNKGQNHLENSEHNKEPVISSEERDLLQNWWLKYQCTFRSEKLGSLSHYPRNSFDYDDETWPFDPEEEKLDALWSELEVVEKEKIVTDMCLENNSESELEAHEEISDGEHLLPARVPSLHDLASKSITSILNSPDIPSLINSLKQQNILDPAEESICLQNDSISVQPPLPLYPPPRTPTPPPPPPRTSTSPPTSPRIPTTLPSPPRKSTPPPPPPRIPTPPPPSSRTPTPAPSLSRTPIARPLMDIPLPPFAHFLSPRVSQVPSPESASFSSSISLLSSPHNVVPPAKLSDLIPNSIPLPTQNLSGFKKQETKKKSLKSIVPQKPSDLMLSRLSNTDSKNDNNAKSIRFSHIPTGHKMTSLSSKTTIMARSSSLDSQRDIDKVLQSQELQYLNQSPHLQRNHISQSSVFPDCALSKHGLFKTYLPPLKKSSLSTKRVPPQIFTEPASSSSNQDFIEGNAVESYSPVDPSGIIVKAQEKKEDYKNSITLCRNDLRKKSFNFRTFWKSHFENSTKVQSHILKRQKLLKRKVFKTTVKTVKKISVHPKARLDFIKENCSREQCSQKSVNGDSTLELKRKYSEECLECLSPPGEISHNNSSKLAGNIPGKPFLDENDAEDFILTNAFVVSTRADRPHRAEDSQICDNKDNCEQFIDDSIPGDPIACKYVVDDEKIEISFEPIVYNLPSTHSEGADTVSFTSKKSPSVVESNCNEDEDNKEDLLNDLQLSSSEDESDEECYTRPRIINGFGDPFIIPQICKENYSVTLPEDNFTTLSVVKSEGGESPKYSSDLQHASNTLAEEYSFKKNEGKDVVSLKQLNNNNIQRSANTNSTSTEHSVLFETNPIENQSPTICNNSVSTIKFKKMGSKKIKKKGTYRKERLNPLILIKSNETYTCKPKRKIEKASTLLQNKIPPQIKEKVSKQSCPPCNLSKPKKSESINELKVSENIKTPQKVVENNTKTEFSHVLTNKNEKIQKSRSIVGKNSDIELFTNPLQTKDKLATKAMKMHSISPPNKTVPKESCSYQPSSIRRRLTNEVENIILIKRDCQNPKTQTSMPSRNLPPTLKRTHSLPEKLLEKPPNNAVLDSIFKGMDATPPPKSLVIKEPETKKFVAQAYWCTQHPTQVSSNPINISGHALKDKTLNNYSHSINLDSHSVNTSSQNRIGSITNFGRSVSLNSNVAQKEENEKLLVSLEGNTNELQLPQKTPCKVKRNYEDDKKTECIKRPRTKCKLYKNKGLPPISPINNNLVGVIENNKTCESLPSMPLIEVEVNLNSSAENLDNHKCETSVSLDTSSVEVPHAPRRSSKHTEKPSIKVSIPLSYLTSMNCYGQLTRELHSLNKKKTGINSGNSDKNHNKTPNYKGEENTFTPIHTNRGDSIERKENNPLNNNLNKQPKRNKAVKKHPISKEHEKTSQVKEIDNIKPNVNNHANQHNYLNPSTVTDKKLQLRVNQRETTESFRRCVERSSIDSESECPTKPKKVLSAGIHNLDANKADVQSDIKSSNIVLPCFKEQNNNPAILISDRPERNLTLDNSVELSSRIVTEDNLLNSEQCQQSTTTILDSLPLDKRNLTVLKDLTSSNDLQVSLSQETSYKLNLAQRKTSNNSSEENSKNGFFTLKVKHPSLLQNNSYMDIETSKPGKQRISVISPEVLSNAVQFGNEETVKRHTWYMEPENKSSNESAGKPPEHDPLINQCKTSSLFSSLLEEPSKKDMLISMLQMSIKFGTKEYDQMHDVIRCIDFDYKQKQNVIEKVKKLSSRDMVRQEIQRASKEYESKLNERQKFFKEIFTKLFDSFKGVNDFVHLAFYVFLSQKIGHFCSKTDLKDSLLNLLKMWIRNDNNKHVFDQSDSAFNNDCDIILQILRQVEDFPLLSSRVDSNQSTRNKREDPEVQSSLSRRNSQENNSSLPVAPSISKHTLEPIEQDLLSDFNVINGAPEPQTPTQCRIMQPDNQFQSKEYPGSHSVSGASSSSEPIMSTATHVIDAHMLQGLQRINNLDMSTHQPESIVSVNPPLKQVEDTNIVITEPVISLRELVQQRSIITQPGFCNNPTESVSNNLQLQFQAQSIPQRSTVPYNNGHHNQINGLLNVHVDDNISLGQKSSAHEFPLGSNNMYSDIQYPNHQVQQNPLSSSYILPNMLVSQTNNTVDKYQSMRQENKQSTMNYHTSNSPNSQVLNSTGSNLTRPPLARNEFSSTKTSPVYVPYNQLPSDQQQNHFNLLSQTDGIVRSSLRCQTRSSSQENQPISQGATQTPQPLRGNHPIHPCQVSKYLVPSNPQKQTRQEIPRQIHFQSFPQSQFTMNTGTGPFSNQNKLATQEGIYPRAPRRLSNVETHNKMSEYSFNYTQQMPGSNHLSSQMLYTASQNVTIHPMPYRRVSNDGIPVQTINQPSMQTFQDMTTSRKQYHCQYNTSGQPVRRLSVATSHMPQQTTMQVPPPSQVLASSLLERDTFQNYHSQNGILCRNDSPEMVQTSSSNIEDRRKSTELPEDVDFDSVTKADLDKLFSLVDSKQIIDLLENIVHEDQENVNRNVSNVGDMSACMQSQSNYDGTQNTALQNIDCNLRSICQAPDGDLIFNGVNVTKDQLLKFMMNCKQQVMYSGLDKDRVTTFISDYKTADGRSFTQEELISLMKGVISMNAREITKVKRSSENNSNLIMIKTLKATAFKDVASYLRIVSILKGLADHNDRDAQQAVKEIADILRIIQQSQKMAESSQVIVLDD